MEHIHIFQFDILHITIIILILLLFGLFCFIFNSLKKVQKDNKYLIEQCNKVRKQLSENCNNHK